MKITVIGGGSTYTPELVSGLLACSGQLPLDELWLMDIDAGRLGIVGGFAERMVAANGRPFKVVLTDNLHEAVTGSAYVITQLRVGQMPARVADEYLGRRHRLIGQETTGVGDFIGSGGKPSPMPLHDVERMLAAAIRPDETPTLANLGFSKGDRVKVTEGPFENFEGVVDEINSQKGTVRVIVTIFGRATPIEIEYWQVEMI